LTSAFTFESGALSLKMVRAMLDRAEKGALLLGTLPPEQACETIAGRYVPEDRLQFRQTRNRLFIEKALLQHLLAPSG
jgi:hypothetical protein